MGWVSFSLGHVSSVYYYVLQVVGRQELWNLGDDLDLDGNSSRVLCSDHLEKKSSFSMGHPPTLMLELDLKGNNGADIIQMIVIE